MAGDAAVGNLYWGDLHNHCSVGLFHYAKGSLRRAMEIAREHLDFWAFTGHSQWPDMPRMPGDAHTKWQEGFDHHTDQWPQTKRLVLDAYEPHRFVTFLGYEWHTARWGDRCILFPDDRGELRQFPDATAIEAYAREAGAMLMPHHIGYKSLLPGRGLNWDLFDPERSPLIEIVSEHGAAERDRGPWPYISHSNGPRTSPNTYQHALELGLHCGVAGGSDDHLGFPGAYGEGLMGVYAAELTREAIWDALWRRRTIAATGDRIAIDLRVNDGFLGDILPAAPRRRIRVRVKAWDEIDRIELLKNNRVLHRHFVDDLDPAPLPGRRLLRVEYGWGPWHAFHMARVADWDFHLQLGGSARIVAWQPCWQSAPFDEDRRHRMHADGERAFRWQSYTSRTGAYHEIPTNAMVFEIDGAASDALTLTLARPAELRFRYTLGQLEAASQVEFTGRFPCESFLLHRLVPREQYETQFELDDTPAGGGEDCYYVRVLQSNGHVAWSSPIWLG